MKNAPRLDLRQGQSLVMTPQLQQAIKLLQMNNLELNSFLQQELDSNPLIESTSADKEQTQSEQLLWEQEKLFQISQQFTQEAYENSFSDSGSDGLTIRHDYETLGQYQDYSGDSSEAMAEDRNLAFKSHDNIYDNLSQQLHMATSNPLYRLIGSYLIGLLDKTGYLSVSLDDIANKLMIPLGKVEKTLEICQTFEPTGVFARHLQECLRLQLIEKNVHDDTLEIILQNLPLLGNKDYSALLKITGLKKEALAIKIQQIKSCVPKPLSSNDSVMQTLIPDVLVTQKEDFSWHLQLNPETLPKVHLNKDYVMRLDKSGVLQQDFIKENHLRATWLIKSLEQRTETILRVCSEILRQQDGFFAYGVSHLRPMNLKIVAQELGLHESTISRVTTGKYMRCPNGVFELKFFFMSGIHSSDADDDTKIASESVKYEIKKLVDTETSKSILSDEDLVVVLKEKNINIARRTVTKYREMMDIPSSIQRRKQKKSL